MRIHSALLLAAALSLTTAIGPPGESPDEFMPQEPSDLIGGDLRAVAYSGFRHGQHPDQGEGAEIPTKAQILEDLRLLSEDDRFTLIRLYDSRRHSRDVLEVIKAENLPLKVMLGAWLDAEISNHQGCAWLTEPIPEEELAANRLANEEQVKQAIELARLYPDVVVAVNVGNEALVDWNDHLVPLESMLRYLEQAREAIDQPVTTADNYAAWVRHGKLLAEAVDFAGVHTYPIWENKTIDEALAYTEENLAAVQRAVPGLPLAIAEAGWPSTASEFPTQASVENQERYFRELMDWSARHQVTTFWFEAFDEDWKGDPGNPQGAEKHWGLYDLDRQPKRVAR